MSRGVLVRGCWRSVESISGSLPRKIEGMKASSPMLLARCGRGVDGGCCCGGDVVKSVAGECRFGGACMFTDAGEVLFLAFGKQSLRRTSFVHAVETPNLLG